MKRNRLISPYLRGSKERVKTCHLPSDPSVARVVDGRVAVQHGLSLPRHGAEVGLSEDLLHRSFAALRDRVVREVSDQAVGVEVGDVACRNESRRLVEGFAKEEGRTNSVRRSPSILGTR